MCKIIIPHKMNVFGGILESVCPSVYPWSACVQILVSIAGRSIKSHLVTGLDLTLFQTTPFRQFQTERVCRRQFQI